MILGFRTSFNRDLRRVRDRPLLKRIQEMIEEVEAADSVLEVRNLKKLQSQGRYYRILGVRTFLQWYRINRIFRINKIFSLLVNVFVGKRRRDYQELNSSNTISRAAEIEMVSYTRFT